MVEATLLVPYSKQKLVAEIYEGAQVLSEEYDEAGAQVRIKADPATIARLESLIAR